MNWPWAELGLSGPAGLAEIRRAYAERLKTTRPEENPDGFQRLHSAYQAACRLARRGDGAETPDDGPRTLEDVPERTEDVASGEAAEASPGKTWDFERLFAEGEAQERGRRFRRTLELRQANKARYETWTPTPSRDPAEMALVWLAVSRALSLVDELAAMGAGRPLWDAFCQSALFRCVRDKPDFVFSLEDFIQDCPSFPEEGCQAFFQAYRFSQRPIRKEYQPLYRLILERGRAARMELFPKPVTRKAVQAFRWLALTLLLSAAVLVNACVDYRVETDARNEQVRHWMGLDFGAEFRLIERRGAWAVLLDTRTQVKCRARWDGPRDMEQGKRGYVTNYAQARLSRTLSAFAETSGCSVYPRYDENAFDAEWSAYYFCLPLTGAGEQITALEELLSAVREEDWYQAVPPEYELYLCWQDWSFYRYDAKEALFPGEDLRRYYEQFFGADICRVALEQTGVAQADMGPDKFLLWSDSGNERIEERDFFHVTGTDDPPVRTLYHYFLSEDCKELFCVPADWDLSGLTLKDLYRMERTLYEVKGFPEKLAVFRPSADGAV